MTFALYLHLYTETPLHAGGSESTGAIDLPIQREATTTLPQIWGQSLKGALKQKVRATNETAMRAWLGSEPGEPAKPGTLDVLDALLVALPVPTLHSTFSWVSSPLVLDRLRRRHTALGRSDFPDSAGLVVTRDEALVPEAVTAPATGAYGPFALVRKHAPVLQQWRPHLTAMLPADPVFEPFRDRFARDLAIVHDEVFQHLGVECTEIQARVQLHRESGDEPEKVKTVQNGPFYAEYLPADTLLSAMVIGPADELTAFADAVRGPVWLGGHESIGKGLLWCHPVPASGGGDR
ncbi:type III-B CRISPR module RAMP protein Cmr4 [Amycolatopsis mediterranei]|uniref:type III-B CRISPR module RAMP protein Cmr4 n=1 Tax=Amycolatopsis mediterranei TaxID=33910 RepID=UPI00342E0121